MNVNALKAEQPTTLQELFEEAGVQEQVPRIEGIYLNPDIQPMPFQLGDLNNALYYGRWGFFSDPGCGKTFPAQAFALYNASYGLKSLVLMPPVLLPQFRRSLFNTFIGSDSVFNVHILKESPYPAKASKKKVQEIRRALHAGDTSSYPKALLEQVDAMLDTADLPFTAKEIDFIRSTSNAPARVAKQLGCSINAVTQIRRGTFREDLFAEWTRRDSWPDLLLMSYQMFIRVNHSVEQHYQVVIADEVHNYLCHPSSTTFKKVRRLVNGLDEPKSFVPMTGTPLPNLPTDAYGIIKLLHPEAYSSLAAFESIHVNKIQQADKSGRSWPIVIGYKNMDLLRMNLFAKASRVTKEEVLSLDKPQVIEVDVELAEEHRALYRKLVRERVLEVNGTTISAVQAQSLRQKALQIATNPDPFSDHPIKENTVRDMLAELLDEIGCKHTEKVVIFAIYNNSVEAMAEWFKDLNPALVYGGSNTAKNVDKFLNDPTCRLMIAHYKSGGVGLNLQDVCRYVICAEPTSVPGEFTQATDRVYRKGQTKVVTFYLLQVRGTGWPKQVEAMRGKMKLSQKVTMDKSELLAELLGEELND